MPTYDYECPKCKKRIEIFHSMNTTKEYRCSECNEKLNKIISGGAGIIFKGTGFYETDYKKKS